MLKSQFRVVVRAAVYVSLAIASIAATCDGPGLSRERMVGCYSTAKDGGVELSVALDSAGYHAGLLTGGRWSEGKLRRPAPGELAQLWGADTAKIAEALVSADSPFGVFRVQRGAYIAGKDSTAEYLVFFLLGTQSLYKVDCSRPVQTR